MSIVASVKVQDAIVLGSDSATQIWGSIPGGQQGVLKVYENAQKLFPLKKLPIGILSYGMGNIGPKSIDTIIREFSKTNNYSTGESYTIENIAKDLSKYISSLHSDLYDELAVEKRPQLGIFIAGYSSNESLGEEWEFNIPTMESPRKVRPKGKYGSSWRGVSLPFSRLYFGHDPRFTREIVPEDKLEETKLVLDKYRTNVMYDGMPVQDAINFVKFILKTTIDYVSFEIGPPSCSEPIQTSVINEEGFYWVMEPSPHLGDKT